jgi:magnesium-transporting ATPase (P-type)
MKGLKNFFYPNKGILGVFAVWAVTLLLSLFSNPQFSSVLQEDTALLAQVLILNLAVMYFLSCLSIWIYEKMKKKK